jgi:hypothetical protein
MPMSLLWWQLIEPIVTNLIPANLSEISFRGFAIVGAYLFWFQIVRRLLTLTQRKRISHPTRTAEDG